MLDRRLPVQSFGASLVLASVILVAGALGACASSPIPAETPGLPQSPVDGVVIAVDSAGLNQVRGFTLRPTNSPFAFSFVLGTLENPTEFSPSHLTEHLASSEPVRAFYRLTDGVPLVYRLEDGGG